MTVSWGEERNETVSFRMVRPRYSSQLRNATVPFRNARKGKRPPADRSPRMAAQRRSGQSPRATRFEITCAARRVGAVLGEEHEGCDCLPLVPVSLSSAALAKSMRKG